jgi:nucleotide-binding universal stress UspA family protein
MGLGSVTDELIRRATMPVLVVRPKEKDPGILPEPVLDNILIPLDGSALAEQVLEPALDLARLMEARCTLLRVVEPPVERAGGGRSDEARTEAAAYLKHVAAKVSSQGLQVQTRVAVAHHAADAILAEAEAPACTLIALATHGRGGLKRLLLGSVADQLVRRALSPVLVNRPAGKEV